MMQTKGLAPYSGAPRQTIINRLFCPISFFYSKFVRQNARSHSQLPPQIPSYSFVFYQKKDITHGDIFFLVCT